MTLLGGAAAAWPLAARAQQPAVPVIGYLHAGLLQDDNVAALRRGLAENGYVEGRNVRIEYREAKNDYSQLKEMAADLLRRRVQVIFPGGGVVAALAAKSLTKSVPIVVVTADDPVASGLVASLNRSGGNVTGITFLATELGPKRFALLRELVPGAMHYALLVNPNSPTTGSQVAELRAAGESMGRHIDIFNADSIGEIDSAFSELVRKGADAVVVGNTGSLFSTRFVHLSTLAAYYRLPVIYADRRAVEVGGLMSYGADMRDAIRQAGNYVGRILKGEKPADLPFVQAAKFELVLNLQTAKILGLQVPASLLAIADEVIE
jgi:putative tryptophan/tyrosine transport system substrate-binding protein